MSFIAALSDIGREDKALFQIVNHVDRRHLARPHGQCSSGSQDAGDGFKALSQRTTRGLRYQFVPTLPKRSDASSRPRLGAGLSLSPSIPEGARDWNLGLGGGGYTLARIARRWSRAKVRWEMSAKNQLVSDIPATKRI